MPRRNAFIVKGHKVVRSNILPLERLGVHNVSFLQSPSFHFIFCSTNSILIIQHLNNQLTHTTLKNVELLKHFKISKTAPTCFGLQGNHHQGATVST